MSKDKYTNPYDLVSKALGCEKDSLNEESSIMNHPKWESVSHVEVIMVLEEEYKITIPDEEVLKYDNMKEILKLYHSLSD